MRMPAPIITFATWRRAAVIFADARSLHAGALRMLESGGIADAAEKAWCATKRATDAMILACTGVEPESLSGTSELLAELTKQSHAFRSMQRRYRFQQSALHGDKCSNRIGRRIHRTADYIDDAERLAFA